MVHEAEASFSIFENRQIEAFSGDSFMSLWRLRRMQIIKTFNHFRVVISKRFDKGRPTGMKAVKYEFRANFACWNFPHKSRKIENHRLVSDAVTQIHSLKFVI